MEMKAEMAVSKREALASWLREIVEPEVKKIKPREYGGLQLIPYVHRAPLFALHGPKQVKVFFKDRTHVNPGKKYPARGAKRGG